MKKRTLFKKIALLIPFISTLNVFLMSTGCADTRAYNADGTDWEGVIKGNFNEDDYVVDHKNSTVTYINSVAIHANNLIIPNYVRIQGRRYKVLLGERCFANNTGIVGSVELNDFIDIIPMQCFRGCVSITTVVFRRYPTAIFNLAFSECLLLDKIYVVDDIGIHSDWASHLTWVGDYAFNQCFMHGDLVFGASLVYLGESAFDSCHEVTRLNMVECKSLNKISDNAFNSCTFLSEVYLSPSIAQIGNGAFSMCIALRKVFLPSNNMDISLGDNAFYQCSNFQGFSQHVTFSKLGAGCFSYNSSLAFSPWDPEYKVSVIEESALSACNISSLSFSPNGPSDVKNYAFSNNPDLSVIDFSAFPSTSSAPKWTGQKIFDSVPVGARRNKTGTIYLPYGGKFSYDWKEFFERNSINIGTGEWIVKNASGRIKKIIEPDVDKRTVVSRVEDHACSAIFTGFKYESEGDINIASDLTVLLHFDQPEITTTISVVPSPHDSTFSVRVEVSNIPDGVTRLVSNNMTIYYKGLHYLGGENQYAIDLI